jgi:hypothetical protein
MPSHRSRRTRTIALGGLAAGIAAALVAIFSALGDPPPDAVANASTAASTSRTVRFGGARVVVHARANGPTCFSVQQAATRPPQSCLRHLTAAAIGYAASPHAIGGVAGEDVRAVIVHVTHRGTVWAQLKDGAFYAALPRGRPARRVVKVLRGGSRTTFTVKPSR